MIYGGRRLVVVMKLVMRCEACQADWKRSMLVPLHKDGDNEEVGNYRGLIDLGCSMAAIFMSVLARRFGALAEDRILTEAQVGFGSHRRCLNEWLVFSGVCV